MMTAIPKVQTHNITARFAARFDGNHVTILRDGDEVLSIPFDAVQSFGDYLIGVAQYGYDLRDGDGRLLNYPSDTLAEAIKDADKLFARQVQREAEAGDIDYGDHSDDWTIIAVSASDNDQHLFEVPYRVNATAEIFEDVAHDERMADLNGLAQSLRSSRF